MKKIFSLFLILVLMTTAITPTASAINDINIKDYHDGSSTQVQSAHGIHESLGDVYEIDFYHFNLQTVSSVMIALQPLDYENECYMTALVYNDDDSVSFELTRAFNELGQRWVSTFSGNLPAGNYSVAVLCDSPKSKYTNAKYFFYYQAIPEEAASSFKDFSDIASEYQYDVEYVVDKGIITGYGDNTFRPKAFLTRGAAAKFIASIRLGSEKANELSTTTAPFKDVSVNHAFASYIAYCSSMKYINGYSDKTFRPNDSLTAAAFAKMLLNAIGFTQDQSRYTGNSWRDNVSQDAKAIGMLGPNVNIGLSDTLTREQAAFMVHRASLYVYPEKIYTTASIDLTVGQTHKLNVSFVPGNTTERDVTWSSSNPNVATVSSSGLVKGVQPGKATIMLKASNGVTTGCVVTVKGKDTSQSAQTTSQSEDDLHRAFLSYHSLTIQVKFPDTLEIYNIWADDNGISIYYSAENSLGQRCRGTYRTVMPAYTSKILTDYFSDSCSSGAGRELNPKLVVR